jgi:hypothetical protein
MEQAARNKFLSGAVPGRTERSIGIASRTLTEKQNRRQNGGSRVKGSRTLLTKRDLPRRGGRNNRIPGISPGELIRPGAVPDG